MSRSVEPKPAQPAVAEANRAVLLGEIAPDALAGRAGVEVAGDPGVLAELFAHLGEPDPDFAVVTP
ncbi:alkyl sulfatase C-terminal domain-containing protein [Streptomyces albidoflavus]